MFASRGLWIAAVGLAAAAAPAGGGESKYPREHIYDTSIGPDEALVNVAVVNHRWPDCTTLESAVQDIFRLEGVADRRRTPDQARALALWKWFRILVSSTGGGYAYEGPAGRQRICYDPHKIFAVYGHHQCDGLSWAMVPLWRAAGYMAFDTATHGHTTASLRYRDADGVQRYHSFDPQARAYYWDGERKRVATRSFPLMTAMVHRHVLAPQRLHSLRTSLRIGEQIRRNWHNTGRVVPSNIREPYHKHRYYAYEPGKNKGIYAVVGEEIQRLSLWPDAKVLQQQLYTGSDNVTCTAGSDPPIYHPAEPDGPGVLVLRLAPPYVAVDALLRASLRKARPDDECKLYLSRDGGPWRLIFEKTKLGTETVELQLGREARQNGTPDVFTAYDVRLKIEMKSARPQGGPAVGETSVVVRRMLNKRTLPNLMPGENVFRVTADRLAKGWSLLLEVEYELKGQKKTSHHVINRFPYYFRIDAAGVKLREIRNYDQDFANEDVRMIGYHMRLLPAKDARPTRSLPEGEVAEKFRQAFPHPADMTRHRKPKGLETDPIQTNGFFPQSRQRLKADERMRELIATLQRNADRSYAAWRAAQELGNYPEAVDVLCKRLATSNLDLTLFICKALAQIADPKSIDPLLKKWQMAPRGAPGTRYIPDCLAAIGDAKVVPALIAKLPAVRFDFRFHIAHALGILGGPEAQKALADLAANDPFPAVREEAKAALAKLKSPARP